MFFVSVKVLLTFLITIFNKIIFNMYVIQIFMYVDYIMSMDDILLVFYSKI